MDFNGIKLIIAGVLAAALIVAVVIENSNDEWAVPLLGLLVGYVVGNARLTENRPIAERSTG